MSIRHAARYVEESMALLVEGFLTLHGWTGPNVPFGARPVVFERRQPKPEELVPATANRVFISFGDMSSARDRQLGSGLLEREFVLFVDILGESEGVTRSLAADIQDRLEGLFGGTRYLRPRHPGTGQELPGYLGEFEDVVTESSNPDLASWKSVKATLRLEFPGDAS